MRKQAKSLAAMIALIGSIAAATSLYADDSRDTGSGMMGPGMMDQGGMMPMMEQMMPMMEQMSEMMDHCSQMMQGTDGGSRVPNEQWRQDAPVTPERDG